MFHTNHFYLNTELKTAEWEFGTEDGNFDKDEAKKIFVIKTIINNIFTTETVKDGWTNKTLRDWSIKNYYLQWKIIEKFIIDNNLVDSVEITYKKDEFGLITATADISKLIDIKKITYKDFTITKEVVMNEKECFVLTNKVGEKIETLSEFETYLNSKISINKKMPHYKLCRDLFDQFLEKSGMGNFLVYPTTYGIGVYNLTSQVEKTALAVSRALTSRGIIFKNEMSKAYLILRFKISKAKSNLVKF